MKYRKDRGTLKELIEKANQDSDAASCFVNGEDWEHCDGVVIVVKGRDEAFRAANILANAGMRTPGKPVVDSQNTGADSGLSASNGYVWRSDMPEREGLYKLKCNESKQQEFDVTITKSKDGSLYADLGMTWVGNVPLIILHRDLTNPQWAHLISVSQTNQGEP